MQHAIRRLDGTLDGGGDRVFSGEGDFDFAADFQQGEGDVDRAAAAFTGLVETGADAFEGALVADMDAQPCRAASFTALSMGWMALASIFTWSPSISGVTVMTIFRPGSRSSRCFSRRSEKTVIS